MSERLAKFSTIALGGMSDRVPVFGNDDPLGVTHFFDGAYRKPNVFRQGLIITYHPQTHSASVLIQDDQSMWTCVFADELVSYSFGFSETHPAREGEFVLVLEIAAFANAGVIIGRIPYSLTFSGSGDRYNDPDQYHRRFYTQDELQKRTWDRNISCFTTPFDNKNDDTTHISTHFRPTDVFAGEFAHVNQHNCGIKGGLFSATLLGGGASLRMSALTNAARLTCESFIRHSMLGTLHEFHNGRYVSSERNIAMYQEERFGGNSKEMKVWIKDDSEAPKEGENQTMRPRMKDLSGFFGHISSKFCLRPDPSDSGIRVQGKSKPKEAGVSRETIDPSGQYRLSAAGMICLERIGRIPVPVRKCYPTDKDHDIPSDPETLKPFEHDSSDPCYRQLELFDRQAYDLKTQYARVDGLGIKEPDYDVPQEDELKPLEDKYDEKFTKSETVKLKKYDKRRAGAYIGEDGSVIIRDAWGSEIVMLGGNVSISCAGNIEILPGQTALTIAGDDIVQKAQNSVDIHSSEHDVRLSAARNMEIVGGGDESKYSGGVIIESRGKKNVSPWDGKDLGEEAKVTGITLRTKNQGVIVDGQKVILRSRKVTKVISGDKNIDGRVDIGAKMIRARGKTIYAASDGAAMAVNRNAFTAIARSIGIYADRSLTLTKGDKYPIPMKWETFSNIAAEYLPKFDEATKDLTKDKDASDGFDSSALEKMVFGFRTSQECRTDRSWVIGGSGGKFRLYEPAWVQVKKMYETLKNGGVDTKAYEEKPEWENGKPFPGKEAEDSAEYAQLSGLQPKNLTSDGFNVSRKTVKEKSEISQVKLKGGYLVRKQ